MLGLTAVVTHQSRGMTIAEPDQRLPPTIEAGRAHFHLRQGQLNLSCAICHDVPETKAPPTDTLRRLPAARILMAMELGKMQPQAAALRPEQRVSLSKWLAAEEDAKRDAWIATRACSRETPVAVTGRQNWGLGRSNMRQAAGVVIDRGNVDQLGVQ